MTSPNRVSRPKTPRMRCSEVSGRRSHWASAAAPRRSAAAPGLASRPGACAGRRGAPPACRAPAPPGPPCPTRSARRPRAHRAPLARHPGRRAEPGDRRGERPAALRVVAELVHRRRGGGEQDDVTRAGQRGGPADRRLHHAAGRLCGARGDHQAIVAPLDLHDGDVRRVSRQRGDDRPAIGADHHRRPQAPGVPGDQLVDRRPFQQAAHHPDHRGRGLRGQRRGCGVRVRRLGVVDVAHPGDRRHQVRAVPAGPEPGEPGRHVPGRDARGAGQRGGGERVGEPGRAAGVHVGDAGERHPPVRSGSERTRRSASLTHPTPLSLRPGAPGTRGRPACRRRFPAGPVRARPASPRPSAPPAPRRAARPPPGRPRPRPPPGRAAPAPWRPRRRPSSRASRDGPRRR